MTNEKDRLEDQNIAEALGRNTPPDLTARILNAADNKLEDAPTPISGAHAVPRNVRPQGRRHTSAVPRRNWQGAGVVAALTLLFAVGLAVFIMWKEPGQGTQQETADQPANQSPLRQRRDDAPEGKHSPNPQPVRDQPEPQPKPDDPTEQPTPEPKPDDTTEQPKPEPKPDDTVEQPKPEPKPDDTVDKPAAKPDHKTAPTPKAEPVIVATFTDKWDRGSFLDENDRAVRRSDDDKWVAASTPDAPGLQHDQALKLYSVEEGTQLRFRCHDITLSNGAQVAIDGEVSVFTHAEGLRVELLKDNIYLDNLRASSTARVTRGDLEVTIGEGAAIIESSKSKLEIFCIDGEVSANGTIVPAGYMASLNSKGLGKLRGAEKADWSHLLLKTARLRQLDFEQFDVPPSGKMITGQLETRTAKQLDEERDGHVAVDTGRSAAVGFGLDGGHSTLSGEVVRVRYRATGAEKVVLQLFCPARNDNFGIDLQPGKDDEWQVIMIKLSDLRDRETHKDAPPPGTNLSSFTIAIEGNKDAQIEVDWVEFARVPRFVE